MFKPDFHLNAADFPPAIHLSLHYSTQAWGEGELEVYQMALSHCLKKVEPALQAVGNLLLVAHASAQLECSVSLMRDHCIIHADLELLRLVDIFTDGLEDCRDRPTSQFPTDTELGRISRLADRLIFHAAYRTGVYRPIFGLKNTAKLEPLPKRGLAGGAIGLAYALNHELHHLSEAHQPTPINSADDPLLDEGLLHMITDMHPFALYDLPTPEVLYRACLDNRGRFARECAADMAGTLSALDLGVNVIQMGPLFSLEAISSVTAIHALLAIIEDHLTTGGTSTQEIVTRDLVMVGFALTALTPAAAKETYKASLSQNAAFTLQRRKRFIGELLILIFLRLSETSRRSTRDLEKVLRRWGYRADRWSKMIMTVNRGDDAELE